VGDTLALSFCFVSISEVHIPNWWFPRQSPGVKANENTNGEHFAEMNQSSKAHAFIREAFQNSIDGAVSEAVPVRIRIFFSGQSKSQGISVWRKYFGSLLKHVEASISDLPLTNEDLDRLSRERCQYIVIEDFGTSGLTGAPDAWDLASGATEENHFYHFYRTVGRSGKASGQLGSWGIGKFVFLMASQLRAMIGLTIPDSGPSKGQPLLMGQSTLRYHVLDGVSYVNDGWFAVSRPSDELALPVGDATVVDEFRKEWNLQRMSEPGFSILVPFADELDSYEILKTIVDEYSGKILDGSLEVLLQDSDLGEDELLTKATIREFLERYRDVDDYPDWGDILRKFDALSWYLGRDSANDIQISKKGLAFRRGEWDLSVVPDETKEYAMSILESQGRVCVQIPVMIHPNSTGKDTPASFELIIGKMEGPKKPFAPEFYRKWLRIGGRRSSTISGYESYLIVKDGILNELLRDAEGPAHTEWNNKRDRFKGKYQHGAAWLKFVKSAPAQIVNCLFGTANDRDTTAFVDLFPKGQHGEGAGKSKETGGHNGPIVTPGRPPEIPVGTDPQIGLWPADDGFYVSVENTGTVRIEMAFDVWQGNPFKKWHKADFQAEKLAVVVQEGSATVTNRSGNILEITFGADELAKVLVTGFDDDRDLRVRAAWLEGVNP
jgi:hypothetical protein